MMEIIKKANVGLFVGINTFLTGGLDNLRYAVNDAVALAYLFVVELKLIDAKYCYLALDSVPTEKMMDKYEKLKELKVEELKPDREIVIQKLKEISSISLDALLVSFFATHGFQSGKQQYLVPSDYNGDNKSAIMVSEISKLLGSKPKLALVILDSCRCNIQTKDCGKVIKDPKHFYIEFPPEIRRYILYSCSLGQVSYEGDGLNHSVFVNYFCKGISERNAERIHTTLGDAIEYTNNSVNAWLGTNCPGFQQNVWTAGDENQRKYVLVDATHKPPHIERIIFRIAVFVVMAVLLGMLWQRGGFTEKFPNRWTNSLGMIFVRIPGSDVLWSVYETRVMDFTAFNKNYTSISGYPSDFNGSNYPIVMVTYNQAVTFCAQLTRSEKDSGILTGVFRQAQYRLPTDSEWSVAIDCTNKTYCPYPWGSNFPPSIAQGNYGTNKDSQHRPKMLPANTPISNHYGIYNLGGNVWEWVTNPSNTVDQDQITRGGAWNTINAVLMESTARSARSSNYSNSTIGFRIILDP